MAANQDKATPLSTILALIELAKALDKAKFKLLDSDHSYSSKHATLADGLISWMSANCL